MRGIETEEKGSYLGGDDATVIVKPKCAFRDAVCALTHLTFWLFVHARSIPRLVNDQTAVVNNDASVIDLQVDSRRRGGRRGAFYNKFRSVSRSSVIR